VFDLYDELAAVVGALDRAQVEYAVCGGIAMAIWSLPRATIDIDLLIEPAALDRAYAAVEPLGYTVKALPMSFSDGAIEIRRVSKFDPSGGDVLMLDYLLVTPLVSDVWATREVVEWEQGKMSVVSKEGLIRLKSFRGAGRDTDDIARLRGEE
jgi:hypothetical protein